MQFENVETFAQNLDETDPLRSFRERFYIPQTDQGADAIYFCGNSLGLQPKKTKDYIQQELDDWARLGVRGHLEAQHPWYPYHEFLTEKTARLMGALPHEVVVMNSLTTNLHLLMVSFYRPTKERFKILMEETAFPSDRYAVGSQAEFHGFSPEQAICSLMPRNGETTLRTEDILSYLDEHGASIALVLLGNVNYLTGQAFDMKAIATKAHEKGCKVGFDLAHGAGNLTLNLHDDNIDFAAWCSYKYLNAGPGAIAGCFVHEHHAKDFTLPRFAGWWGHDKDKRFEMAPNFQPMTGAEGWQLSNPPIFQLAALRASMDLFDEAGRERLQEKRRKLTNYLAFLLNGLTDFVEIITPGDSRERGSQISLRVKRQAPEVVKTLEREGIICDFRKPDIIRVAPVPLYNQFAEVFSFVKILERQGK